MLPAFERSGNLPPGIHRVSWAQLAERFGETAYRRKLLAGLQAALQGLRAAGCSTAYVDGSFVTVKQTPADFDGCWEPAGVDPTLVDPVLLDFSAGRAVQKAKYGGELFPAQMREGASGRSFLEFFQIDGRTGRPKGIVCLELRSLP